MATVIESGIRKIRYAGEPAWQKCHPGETRRWRLAALDAVVRGLKLTPLRPPPRLASAEACALERRRLLELSEAGVHVPRILAHDARCLVLSDMGRTLAGSLRETEPDDSHALFVGAAGEIARIHRAGQYLGQPQARNITVDEQGRIGFLDFEEDPLEVMSLEDAQSRDWLLFMAGTARHLPHDAETLGAALGEPMSTLPEPVRGALGKAVSRLGFLAWLDRFEGRRIAGLGKAVKALKFATTSWGVMLLLLALGVDYLHDGDLEIVQLLAPLFE